MQTTRLVQAIGKAPFVGATLRWLARRYREGSVVTIQHGEAKGFKWERHHRYVSGYWIGHYEPAVQNALKRELKPGDTFFDLGANAGFFTLVAAKLVGPGGKCVAIEPSPLNVQSIKAQIELNGLGNCHIVNSAVSDTTGEAAFSYLSIDTARGRLGDGTADVDKRITVKVTTLDLIAAQWGMPDFIKMDVEGAETQVLQACRQVIEEGRPGWLIELHGPECESKVRQTLAAAKYRFFDLDGHPIPENQPLPDHVLALPSQA